MFTVINAADDQFDLEGIKTVGPTLAISKDEDLIFNHQSSSTDKLLSPKLTPEQEAKAVAELLVDEEITICLNVLGAFEIVDVDTYQELAELDIDSDFYVSGTVLEVRPGQLHLQTEDEDSMWIMFKHIDSIEFAESAEPYEVEEEVEEE
ncbi:MAG: hypothetical protein ABSF09_09185 [Candidatus Bathyarchaeia archaeon]|jgi:hypothetical protein